MTQRTITLFGFIEEDGSLKRATFNQAYELAIGRLPNTRLPETWQLVHDRACRTFAHSQLLGSDRGYFLHMAGVPLQEGKYDAQFADLCVREVCDVMYAEDPRPEAFAREIEELLRDIEAEPKPRVPNRDEVLLDDEIELLRVDVY